MHFSSQTSSDGIVERLFDLDGVPGVLWSPDGGAGSRPLVLLGHGGGGHKAGPGMAARARRYVTACGFAVAAIDAPGFGARPRTERDEQFVADNQAAGRCRRPGRPPHRPA